MLKAGWMVSIFGVLAGVLTVSASRTSSSVTARRTAREGRTRTTVKLAWKQLDSAQTARPSSSVVTGYVSLPPGSATVTSTARTAVMSPPVHPEDVMRAGEPAVMACAC